MGRWGRHPMDSDGALDAKSVITDDVYNYCEENKIDFWSKEADGLMSEFLQKISLDDLKKLAKEEHISENRFVIPYTYLEYKVNRPELKDFLIECFNYHADITGEWNYCGETDEHGEILELKHIRIFKENYDAVMSGEFNLPKNSISGLEEVKDIYADLEEIHRNRVLSKIAEKDILKKRIRSIKKALKLKDTGVTNVLLSRSENNSHYQINVYFNRTNEMPNDEISDFILNCILSYKEEDLFDIIEICFLSTKVEAHYGGYHTKYNFYKSMYKGKY